MYCGQLFLDVALVARQHFRINDLWKILLFDVMGVDVVDGCAQTRHRVKSSHIGSPALQQDSFLGFGGNISARTNAHKGSAPIADGWKQ